MLRRQLFHQALAAAMSGFDGPFVPSHPPNTYCPLCFTHVPEPLYVLSHLKHFWCPRCSIVWGVKE